MASSYLDRKRRIHGHGIGEGEGIGGSRAFVQTAGRLAAPRETI
jgi:hypothetical protein